MSENDRLLDYLRRLDLQEREQAEPVRRRRIVTYKGQPHYCDFDGNGLVYTPVHGPQCCCKACLDKAVSDFQRGLLTDIYKHVHNI